MASTSDGRCIRPTARYAVVTPRLEWSRNLLTSSEMKETRSQDGMRILDEIVSGKIVKIRSGSFIGTRGFVAAHPLRERPINHVLAIDNLDNDASRGSSYPFDECRYLVT